MSSDPSTLAQPVNTSDRSDQRVLWAFGVSIVAGLGIILPVEYQRLRESLDSETGWLGWLTFINLDTTPYFFAFLLLPIAWGLRTRGNWKTRSVGRILQSWFGQNTKPNADTSGLERIRACVLAGVVAVVSFGMSFYFGITPVTVRTATSQFDTTLSELPPALHDEYSYLFQAETFLAGRVAYPSQLSCPELFDQIHVLNDNGRFAGRYFPGTAIWMSPFVAIGKPYWGHWLAGALSAAFVFFIGRELAGNAVGLIAGLLAALSPGILTFGQLLLAHHPALVSLTFFTWMFLRMMRTRSFANAALAGAGLIFAVLCRPMTAAGIGLPFGVWLVSWWIRGDEASVNDLHENWSLKRRTLLVASMGLPICLGIGGMLIYNARITGNMLVTPYQLYTDIYTPRHVYGFNNVERAKASTSTKVVEKYDSWAENLTPALAMRNVKDRLIASGQWIWGLIPLAMSVCVFPFVAGRNSAAPALSDRRWWLILLAAVSLHLAHIPYWYAGIRNWHYVFEAAPFVLLVHAGVTWYFLSKWWRQGSLGICIWWVSLSFISLIVSYVPLTGDPPVSRVRLALLESTWARRSYAVFNRVLDDVIAEKPALVLIAEDSSDRHIDYVTNDPTLDARVIRGRFRPDINPLETVLTAYSDRAVYAVILDRAILANIERGQYAGVRFDYVAEEPIVSGTAVVYRLSLRSDQESE